MRPGGGKQKGSAFEREIAKKLSLWWSSGEDARVFWRSASSGQIKAHGMAGDITSVHGGEAFTSKVFIECKCGKQVDLTDWFRNSSKKRSNIKEWWAKAQEESATVQCPFIWLVVKRDREDTLVVTNKEFIEFFERVCGKVWRHVPSMVLNLPVEMGRVFIFHLDWLLDIMDPGIFQGDGEIQIGNGPAPSGAGSGRPGT